MKRFCLCCLLFFLLFLPLFAEDEVFAPFVSRLKVVPEGPRVKITWNDSTDVTGQYIIYRYSEEIDEVNFRLADIAGRVPTGKEFFIDTPPEFGKQYYYAVLAESESGELYELFIPFRNKTIYAVSIEQVATLEELAATVTSIDAEPQEDYILLSYAADKKGRELSIYRSISPIEGSEDVLSAELITLVSSSDDQYRDFAIPGIHYYYGIIDSELAKAGDFAFIPGKNATTTGRAIAMSSETESGPIVQSRARPLPFLTINSALTTGKELAVSPLPQRRLEELPKDIADILKDLIGTSGGRPAAMPEPVLLETDRIRIAEGESYSLGRILDSVFMAKEWEEAEQRLVSFQRTRHAGTDDLRSHFYLGQVLFFREEYRRAFYEFVRTRDAYRREVDPWIDAVLIRLR